MEPVSYTHLDVYKRQAFNQAVAASSATAVIGWLQNLLWIIAITYPIAYFICLLYTSPVPEKNHATEKIIGGYPG